jgi:hypothetical protein
MGTSGAAVVSLEEFAQGQPVQQEKTANPRHYVQIQRRAYESVSRMPQCDFLSRNCEHYAYWLLGEKPHSPQITGLFIAALVAGWLKLAAA